jgi:hypothetical protein
LNISLLITPRQIDSTRANPAQRLRQHETSDNLYSGRVYLGEQRANWVVFDLNKTGAVTKAPKRRGPSARESHTPAAAKTERRSRLACPRSGLAEVAETMAFTGKRFAVSSPCSRSLIGASKCRQAASAFMPIAIRLWEIIQSEARARSAAHRTRRACSAPFLNSTARGSRRLSVWACASKS